jgi:hypothetical protein
MSASTPDNSGVDSTPASTTPASPTDEAAAPGGGAPGGGAPGGGAPGGGAPGGGAPGGGAPGGGAPGGGIVTDTVDKTRSITGLLAVVGGDIAIAVAAILGILHISSSSTQSAQFVAILTSAFTAIGTMTTAYFGIKSISNTAQALGQNPPGGTTQTPPGRTTS